MNQTLRIVDGVLKYDNKLNNDGFFSKGLLIKVGYGLYGVAGHQAA